MDVLHSWAVPSLGVKVDVCPGRLKQVFYLLEEKACYMPNVANSVVLIMASYLLLYKLLAKRMGTLAIKGDGE